MREKRLRYRSRFIDKMKSASNDHIGCRNKIPIKLSKKL